MPSHAPLSSRDGRIRSSSIQHGREPFYYTNEDIELLHQVVSLGQDILPTLPKRDKLPTTALFRAADIVFPRHGLDPDGEDKLSRIIFLVGGMRSTDNLLDRFRTVLGRMGIELEYVPQSGSDDGDDDEEADEDDPPSPAPAGRRPSHHPHMHASPPSPHPPPAPSVRSAAPSSAGGLTAPSGVFPVARHVNGRRRRNSDSIAQFIAATDADQYDRGRDYHHHNQQGQQGRQEHRPHRRRSDSLAPPLLNYKDHFGQVEEPREPLPRPSHASRPIDPWLSQIPHYSTELDTAGHAQTQDVTTDDLHNVDDQEAVEDEEGHDADYGYDRDDIPGGDEYTRSLDMLRPATQQQHEYNHHHLNIIPGDVIGAHVASHLAHSHNYQHHEDLPFRTRPFPQPLAPSTVPGGSFHVPLHSHNSSMQPAGSWTEPQSPQSRLSSLATDYEAFPGASDMTMQEELEAGPPPKVDLHIMAKVADTYFLRFAFLGGLAIDAWRTICVAHQEQERYAAQMDRELSTSEALLVWSDVAGTHVYETTGKTREIHTARSDKDDDNEAGVKRQSADHGDNEDENEDEVDDDDDQATAQYRQKQEERERLMKRAARVYTITTLFNAVTHWQAMAQEEASRTKVARRHLLRRKVFGAWRAQTVRDNVKINSFTLDWAVQRWANSLHQVQKDNEQRAVQFYRHDLVTVKFWTWFRTHQERTAALWATDRLKKQAIESWCNSTIAAAGAQEEAAAKARQALLSAAAGQWIEQTQTQALIMLREEEKEDKISMQAAFQDWAKEAFCQRQLRAVQSANETKTKAAVMGFWCQGAAEAQNRIVQQNLGITNVYMTHWRCETRLALLRADYEYNLKADAVYSWVLAEKLAFLLRYRDEQLVWKTCLALKAAYGSGQGEQEREDELAQAADGLYKANVFSKLVSTFRSQKEEYDFQQETADYMDQATLAHRSLGHWMGAVDDHTEMDALAHRGAFYVGVANTLDGWPAYARAVREERLRSTYRSFRRTVKRQTAADCVGAWRAAALHQGAETHGDGGYATADRLRHEHEAYAVFTTLNHWILETNDRLFQQSLAAEADAEVYLSRWRLQLADCEELGAAAAEHDTVSQLVGRWDDWELQAVQARAKKHTATALHEKNNRRLGRRVLAVWQQQLADQLYLDSARPEDLQVSYAAPSTPRWPGEGGGHKYSSSAGVWRLGSSLSSPVATRSDVPAPLPYSASGYNDRYGPRETERGHSNVPSAGTRPASFLLHPITETPVATTAQRPFYGRGGGGDVGGVGGSYSVPAPGTAATITPPSTGIVQLRRLHRSTAAVATAPYRQQQQQIQQPQQRQQLLQQHTPLPASTLPAATTPARESHRHRLLQQRLQSASRLADSVQLGPMSEFDEAEAVDARAGADDADDDLGLGGYADVSSEGDEEDRGGDNVLIPAHRQRLSSADDANTPRRHYRPSEQEPLRHEAFRSVGGIMRHSASNPPVREPREPNVRYRPIYALRKSTTDAASAAAPPFNAVTTTPMGPLPSSFEQRLRAVYGEEEDDEDVDVGGMSRPSNAVAAATPLRRLPLRMSTMSTAARTGARVTFADVGRERIEE